MLFAQACLPLERENSFCPQRGPRSLVGENKSPDPEEGWGGWSSRGWKRERKGDPDRAAELGPTWGWVEKWGEGRRRTGVGGAEPPKRPFAPLPPP